MLTRLLNASSPRDLDEAAALIAGGGLVAFPTETVYGLGALALEPLAVRAVYAAKGRPATNPLIVHVLGEREARALCAVWPAEANELAARFWPGPLTLVLPRADAVPDEVTAGGPTVAVRSPAHAGARALLQRVGRPLAGPSANRSEHVSPTTAAHVLRDLNGRIDAVLDGGRCPVGIESTVLALDEPGRGRPRLLRVGAIPRAALEEIVGELAAGPAPDAGEAKASPGLHRRHYAPAALVRLAEPDALAGEARRLASGGERVGALVRSEVALPDGVQRLRLPAHAEGYGRDLYAALRELEDRGCTAIAIEAVPRTAEWDAIRDRLVRAAATP